MPTKKPPAIDARMLAASGALTDSVNKSEPIYVYRPSASVLLYAGSLWAIMIMIALLIVSLANSP